MDQRIATRRRTFLGARLEAKKLPAWSVACAVKNLSDGGAKIALPAEVTIPDVFAIGMAAPGSGQAVQARLVWYRDGFAGIAFSDMGPLASDAEGA